MAWLKQESSRNQMTFIQLSVVWFLIIYLFVCALMKLINYFITYLFRDTRIKLFVKQWKVDFYFTAVMHVPVNRFSLMTLTFLYSP